MGTHLKLSKLTEHNAPGLETVADSQIMPPSSENKQGKGIGPLFVRGLAEVLEQHGDWLDSNGETGIQADFSDENLEGADLVDARLQDAILDRANLKRADLMLADLRGSSLLQANLQGANLLGAAFHQATLQAANLQGAQGLFNRQFSGANLFGAVLPAEISPAEGLNQIREVTGKAAWLLISVLILNILVWIRIFTTHDSELLKNGPAVPFLGLQADFPFVPFYLFGPVVILCVYVCFHLYLQRLWDGASQLPAIFPDGRNLDTCLPWFARWSARMHFKWLRGTRSPLAFLETTISITLLYWVAPATVFLFWVRYLTLEDPRGTTVHVLLVAGAVAAALNFPRMVGKAFGTDLSRPSIANGTAGRRAKRLRNYLPLGIGAVLLLISIGTIFGAPSRNGSVSESVNAGPNRWAADILWTVGYNPYAQVTETDVSTKPATWSGSDEDLAQVKGASLNGLRLRFMQAYGAFFAKAHLWQADLRNANLAEADLREANLREANLQSAVLDHAKLIGASLEQANLRHSNLNRSNLQGANLSSANAAGATLLDSTLDGVNLYKTDFRNASLQRASMKQADLREANFENANLTMANLQEAYLTSTKLANSQLTQADFSLAILTDADLRKSDLSGADLRGAILRGADMTGANLQDVNLVGALGVTAGQICSATSLARIQLDENLRIDVESQCGSARQPPDPSKPVKNGSSQ
jgi:uncharacterized protein YjbI with pentapeptide repeats